jgi:transcriptional regulator with XRE-family HTH domain
MKITPRLHLDSLKAKPRLLVIPTGTLPERYKQSFTTAEKLIEEVRKEIFEDQSTYKNIAQRTGVSPSTIGNLASGKTRWPRPTTLFPLLDSLNLEMKILKKGTRT